MQFASRGAVKGSMRGGAMSQMMLDNNSNKHNENQMLFFADRRNTGRKEAASRPKTIQEIKKLQKFVK